MTDHTSATAQAIPVWQRPLQAAGLVVFIGLAIWLAAAVVEGTLKFSHGWYVAGLAVAGYLAADLASGIVHFLADNFGSETTPFFGPGFVRPFRDHHADPRGILAHGFVAANGNNALVSTPILAPVALLLPVSESVWAHLVGSFMLFMMLAVFVTNQFHKWAHMESPPRLACRLQSLGLILSREHHAVHHTTPHNAHYCITLGAWDPVLERTRFFERLERGLRRWIPGTHPISRVERDQSVRG